MLWKHKCFRRMKMPDMFYDVMHTLNFKDTTDDFTAFCYRNEKALVWNFIMAH